MSTPSNLRTIAFHAEKRRTLEENEPDIPMGPWLGDTVDDRIKLAFDDLDQWAEDPCKGYGGFPICKETVLVILCFYCRY